MKNQQVLWTSLFRLGKRRPFVARPPKAKEEHRNQNLGEGAQSSACKTGRQEKGGVSFRIATVTDSS